MSSVQTDSESNSDESNSDESESYDSSDEKSNSKINFSSESSEDYPKPPTNKKLK